MSTIIRLLVVFTMGYLARHAHRQYSQGDEKVGATLGMMAMALAMTLGVLTGGD